MEDIEQEGQDGNIQQEAVQLGTVEEIDGVELSFIFGRINSSLFHEDQGTYQQQGRYSPH